MAQHRDSYCFWYVKEARDGQFSECALSYGRQSEGHAVVQMKDIFCNFIFTGMQEREWNGFSVNLNLNTVIARNYIVNYWLRCIESFIVLVSVLLCMDVLWCFSSRHLAIGVSDSAPFLNGDTPARIFLHYHSSAPSHKTTLSPRYQPEPQLWQSLNAVVLMHAIVCTILMLCVWAILCEWALLCIWVLLCAWALLRLWAVLYVWAL